MKNVILVLACAVTLMAVPAAAQPATEKPKSPEQVMKDVAQTQAIKQKIDEAQAANARFVRTLTNVQVELTISDQIGTQTPQKKTVSMIAASGNWGKIRSEATVYPAGEPPYGVLLNVDARPFVSTDGPVQLELTLVYAPVKSTGDIKEISARQRPSGVNQSQTVVLQSGKPLVISQAADPVSDRKVLVEVKATVLK